MKSLDNFTYIDNIDILNCDNVVWIYKIIILSDVVV